MGADVGASVVPCDLTVVIVNYNVRYFLEQCLYSVARAGEGLDVQVIVVDNASADHSVEMLLARSDVEVIANAENVGFAKANNQGIRIARGRYVLLLNPDTLVPADAFRTCLAYADANHRVGAIGVRMVDGSGRYLPESKRGLPTPWVSFAKMSGLSKLAPRSARYNGYYLGHLGEFETSDVDVLPGAFMWLRPEALAQVGGGLDEDYFMYGEDIDLSYLIQRAGFRVVYLPEVSIVHYKGESTRKRSWRYVKAFYRAMAIFSRKHLQRGGPSPQPFLELAIYGRAALAVATNALVALLPLLADAAVLLSALLLVKHTWAVYYFADADYYATSGFGTVNTPIYLVAWLLGLYVSGAYDRPFRLRAALRGVGAGTVLALLVYALLPAQYHTSRAILVLGAGLGGALLGAWRLSWAQFRPGDVSLTRAEAGRDRRLVIAGSEEEAAATLSLLGRAGVARQYFGRITTAESAAPTTWPRQDPAAAPLGSVSELPAIVRAFGIDEVVFGLGTVGVGEVIGRMREVGTSVDYRTLAPGAGAVVGSPSRNAPGEAYALEQPPTLSTAWARRSKRSMDVALALGLLLVPPLALVSSAPGRVLRNAIGVLFGHLTWVGYSGRGRRHASLPPLRTGVLAQGKDDGQDPVGGQVQWESVGAFAKTDVQYARHWRLSDDLREVYRRRRALGDQPQAPSRAAGRWSSTPVSSHPPTRRS